MVTSTILVTSAAPQQRTPRVALVIGNANYPDASTPLSTTIRDARTVADELRRSEFDVDFRENVGKEALQRAIETFSSKISAGTAALFYFNGYGLQVGRQTYLVPVNAQLWTEADVRRDGINVDAVLAEMHRKGAKIKIIILDAARRNPFERRFRAAAEGLAALNAPDGTLAIFPAAPGKVVTESTGTNSIFTGELIKELRSPNLSAEEVFNRTRIGVSRASASEQIPWVVSSLADEFYFGISRGADSARPARSHSQSQPSIALQSSPRTQSQSTPAQPTETSDANTAMRRDYELAAQIGTLQAWDSFLASYPKGLHADLARAAREKIVIADRAAAAAEVAKARADAAEKSQSNNAAAERAKADAAKLASEAAVRSSQEAAEKARAESNKLQVVSIAPGGADPKEITQALKSELRRVGCHTGVVDGNWNSATERSLENFNRYSGMKVATKSANVDALDAVKAKASRICPLVCETGFRAEGERCVAIICPSGEKLGDGGKCQKETPKTATRSLPPAKGVADRQKPASKSGSPQVACGRNGCVEVKPGCRAVSENSGGLSGAPTGMNVICP